MVDSTERCLWKMSEGPPRFKSIETLESIRSRFASSPPRKSLWQLCSSSLAVVQEISMTGYLLVRHRVLTTGSSKRLAEVTPSLTASNCAIVVALLTVLFYGSFVDMRQNKKTKIKQRVTDGALSAIFLRLLSSMLQSLTASYASDSLYTLALAGLSLHVLACDYSYANGLMLDKAIRSTERNSSERLLFQGGTVSLNSALFSTVLLASRLEVADVYFFIYLAIVLFAFFPVTRNFIASRFPAEECVALWLITLMISSATALLLESWSEVLLLLLLLLTVGFILPLWRYIAQSYKVFLAGPWDIPARIT